MSGLKKYGLFLFVVIFGLSGCGTVHYERAHVLGFKVSNPTLGRGVAYSLPPGYSVMDAQSDATDKFQNKQFEQYLRAITAKNDTPNSRHAFNESLLFRMRDRYVVIFHASINFPSTFASLPPQDRARLLPILANEDRRFFAIPNKNYQAAQTQHQGNTVLEHLSFQINAAGQAGEGWVGTGFSFVGAVTDLVSVFVLAREEDASAAQADRQYILDHFSYGAAASKVE